MNKILKFFFICFIFILFTGCLAEDPDLKKVKFDFSVSGSSETIPGNLAVKGSKYNRMYKVDIPGNLEIKIKPSESMYEAELDWDGATQPIITVYVEGTALSKGTEFLSSQDGSNIIFQFKVK